MTVTDHGKPVARVVPYTAAGDLEHWLAPTVYREVLARATARGISAERVLSELAALGIERSEDAAPRVRSGIPVMRGAPGHAVTDELVAEYRDDL